MYVDWVVDDCADYSIEKKKTLQNLFFMVRYCGICVFFFFTKTLQCWSFLWFYLVYILLLYLLNIPMVEGRQRTP